jgi:CHAT domain-containing protein/tetratricopeptide (TPR) repeat protein
LLFSWDIAVAQPGQPAAPAAGAQGTVAEIVSGREAARELKAGEHHSYRVELAAGHLLSAIVEQQGVDVVVTLYGPDGAKLLEVDSPNGADGPEPVFFIAEGAGQYRLEVRTLEANAAAGRYLLKSMEVRPASAQDRSRLADLGEIKSSEEQVLKLYGERRLDDALAPAERALVLRERVYGADCPEVADALDRLATLHRDRGDTARAEELWTRSLAIREKALGPEHLSVAVTLGNLGVLRWSRGDVAGTRGAYERSLHILEKSLGSEHPFVAGALHLLAGVLQVQSDFKRAEEYYGRALAIREKALGPEHLDVAVTLNGLGTVARLKGDYVSAVKYLERSISICEKARPAGDPSVAMPLMNLASVAMERGEFERAEQLVGRALALLEKAFGPEHPALLDAINLSGWVYKVRADPARSEQFLRRAVAISEKAFGPDNAGLAAPLTNLGELARERGDYAEAARLALRASALSEKFYPVDSVVNVRVLTVLAKIASEQGDLAGGENYLKRALANIEKAFGPEHPAIPSLLNELGGLYLERNMRAEAEATIRRSMQMSEKLLGAEHPTTAVALGTLGSFYLENSDYPNAEQSLLRALAIFEKSYGPENPLVASSLNNLADLEQRNGDYVQAEQLFRRAMGIVEKTFGPEHDGIAASLNHLAINAVRQGDYARAESYLTRSSAILERRYGPNHLGVATALGNMAFTQLARGDIEGAIRTSRRVFEIRDYNYDLILATGSERQKRAFVENNSGEIDFAVAMHVGAAPRDREAARLALGLILQRKGRALDAMTNQLAALRSRLDAEGRALLDRLAEKRAQLAAIYFKKGSSGAGAAVQPREQAAKLAAEIEELEAQAVTRGGVAATRGKGDMLVRVQRTLPPGAALVEFVRYLEFTPKLASLRDPQPVLVRFAAYVLKLGAEPAVVDLGEAAAIDAAVREFGAAISDPASRDVARTARALDELAMRPVRAALGDVRLVLVSPDGSLNLIPFSALVDEGGHYLVEKYTFDYLTSGRDLLRFDTPAQSRGRPLVVADPDYDLVNGPAAPPRKAAGRRMRSGDPTSMRWTRLAGTEDEARSLGSVLQGAKFLTGREATERALKSVAGPHILHVATHGFFLPDQQRSAQLNLKNLDEPLAAAGGISPLLRSGLSLAGANNRDGGAGEDGVLTALEVSGLDLRGTKLVVLSACDTGVGEIKNGDGVYGLRRALVLAGSECQMTSLWLVDDIATQELMTDFYARVLRGDGRAEALRQVQLKMLKRDGRKHPFFWASFITVGDWRAIRTEAAPAR